MKWLFLLALPLLFSFTACNELFDPDNCKDCQAAIDHMCEKIGANSCNPAWMQNAQERIIEDCDFDQSVYIGYMAEACATFGLRCPTCATNPSTTNLAMLFTNDNGSTDSLEILVRVSQNEELISFPPNSSFFYDFSGTIRFTEGTAVQFTLLDKKTEKVLDQFDKIFSFARPGGYDKIRVVIINKYVDNNSQPAYRFKLEDW